MEESMQSSEPKALADLKDLLHNWKVMGWRWFGHSDCDIVLLIKQTNVNYEMIPLFPFILSHTK